LRQKIPTFVFKLVSFVNHLLIHDLSGHGSRGNPSIESW
jgi:hypothetical protein